MKKSSLKHTYFFQHKTKLETIVKFSLVLMVVSLYFLYVSLQYGLQDGFYVTALTWSFFVFCTPVADAGFLIDFPIRLLFKVRMIYSEIVTVSIAMLINIFTYFLYPAIYQKTLILKLFYHILSQPIPYWLIIIISLAGTFLSIHFADELVDVASHEKRVRFHKHHHKYQIVLLLFVIFVIVILYDLLLKSLNLQIPL